MRDQIKQEKSRRRVAIIYPREVLRSSRRVAMLVLHPGRSASQTQRWQRMIYRRNTMRWTISTHGSRRSPEAIGMLCKSAMSAQGSTIEVGKAFHMLAWDTHQPKNLRKSPISGRRPRHTCWLPMSLCVLLSTHTLVCTHLGGGRGQSTPFHDCLCKILRITGLLQLHTHQHAIIHRALQQGARLLMRPAITSSGSSPRSTPARKCNRGCRSDCNWADHKKTKMMTASWFYLQGARAMTNPYLHRPFENLGDETPSMFIPVYLQ